MAQLTYDDITGLYVLEASYSQRDTAKACRFRWWPAIHLWVKESWTKEEVGLFLKVFPYVTMDPNLHDELLMMNRNFENRFFGSDNPMSFVTPGGLVPHAFQVHGASFLAQSEKAILADVMGLGKTVQSIVAVNWLSKKHSMQVMVVAPKSVLPEWRYHVSEHATKPEAWRFVTYDYVRRNVGELVDYNHRVSSNRRILILDEASYVKNWQSGRTQAVMEWSRQFRYVWMLTATPIRSNIGEAFPLLSMARPMMFNSQGNHPYARAESAYWRFVREWAYTYRPEGRGVIVGGLKKKKEAEFRKMISPFVLRRERDQIDLPELERRIVRVDMSPEQERLYKRAENGFLETYKDGVHTVETIKTDFAALTRLRQLSLAPSIVNANGDSGKSEWICEWAQSNANEHKTVIFVAYREFAQDLASALGGRLLLGGMTEKQFKDVVKEFKSDGQGAFLICTYETGSFGLNLQEADTVIWASLPWTPDILEQGTARAWRQGQKRDVQELILIHPGTIDEAMLRTLKRKQAIFDRAFGIKETIKEMLRERG